MMQFSTLDLGLFNSDPVAYFGQWWPLCGSLFSTLTFHWSMLAHLAHLSWLMPQFPLVSMPARRPTWHIPAAQAPSSRDQCHESQKWDPNAETDQAKPSLYLQRKIPATIRKVQPKEEMETELDILKS